MDCRSQLGFGPRNARLHHRIHDADDLRLGRYAQSYVQGRSTREHRCRCGHSQRFRARHHRVHQHGNLDLLGPDIIQPQTLPHLTVSCTAALSGTSPNAGLFCYVLFLKIQALNCYFNCFFGGLTRFVFNGCRNGVIARRQIDFYFVIGTL